MIKISVRPAWFIGVIILLAFFRFVPHPPNATPIAAMALFAGAFFSNRMLAYFVPLAAMLISDLLIGFHSTLAYVYLGIAITVFIGSCLNKIDILNVGLAALLASLVFFFITNFGAWLHHGIYEKNITGLMQAYIAGLPFFRNAIIANLIFSYLAFFGFKNAFEWLSAAKKSYF